jgi:hypothetical protein
MLPALTGPVLAAAGLLALAAPAKLARPANTANALGQLGLPRSTALVRLLGVGELALAVAVLLAPSRPVLALLATAYLGFAGFVLLALRRGTALSSCGCFGKADTPPTRVHVAVVAAFAAVALSAVATGSASLPEVLRAPAAGLPVLAAAAMTGWLSWVALAVLPQVVVASRGQAPAPSTDFRLTAAPAVPVRSAER